ncbi:MAG: riboflavin synthase [Bacteroidetes bacterium]|nr:riboflavin synthase [Bacteroidota bacterium]
MFTGLVEEIGKVKQVRRSGDYQQITIEAATTLNDLNPGDSIAVNGVCQTVTTIFKNLFTVDTLAVSLKKTTLGDLKPGSPVNLERALTLTTRMGGHIVQGHVDGVGSITKLKRNQKNIFMEILLPQTLSRYCVAEGSLAVDGISLTIAEIRGSHVTVNVIPTTWDDTVLKYRKHGDRVNLEVDILARYVEKLLVR